MKKYLTYKTLRGYLYEVGCLDNCYHPTQAQLDRKNKLEAKLVEQEVLLEDGSFNLKSKNPHYSKLDHYFEKTFC